MFNTKTLLSLYGRQCRNLVPGMPFSNAYSCTITLVCALTHARHYAELQVRCLYDDVVFNRHVRRICHCLLGMPGECAASDMSLHLFSLPVKAQMCMFQIIYRYCSSARTLSVKFLINLCSNFSRTIFAAVLYILFFYAANRPTRLKEKNTTCFAYIIYIAFYATTFPHLCATHCMFTNVGKMQHFFLLRL